MTDFDTLLAARSRWAVALGTLPREAVLTLGKQFTDTFQITPVTVPQSGLALVSLRDSVEKQHFFLGEIPLSTSHILIADGNGTTVEGGAYLMADDADLASALAICDGVLAHRLTGWESVAEQVQAGFAHLDQEARVRKTILTRSRVNFSLLNEEDTVEGADDDDID